MAELSPAIPERKPLWIALLLSAGLVLSLGFACAVPLAAFAAIAALTLNRHPALALVGAVWLVNQCAGFSVHHYPLDPGTFGWGAALGAVALASALAAQWGKERLPEAGKPVAAFLAAFAAYEGALFAISLFAGSGASNFTFSIVSRILAINAAAFTALFLIYRLGSFAGLAKAPGRTAARPLRFMRKA